MYMLHKPDSMQCEDIHCNKMFVILIIPLLSELQGIHTGTLCHLLKPDTTTI